jgi:hypothetical protein
MAFGQLTANFDFQFSRWSFIVMDNTRIFDQRACPQYA